MTNQLVCIKPSCRIFYHCCKHFKMSNMENSKYQIIYNYVCRREYPAQSSEPQKRSIRRMWNQEAPVYWKTRARTRVHGHADTDTRTRTLMEKTGSYGKDGQLWKRRAVMEKTGTYGKDGQLWKRRAVMEKTDTYGKDGHLWKRRTQSI